MESPFINKKFIATGVGSLPHQDVTLACQFILDNFKDDIIFWPQLVKRSFLENMYVQYSQNIPGVVIAREKQRIYIDTDNNNFLGEMEKAIRHYSDEDLDYFAISEDYAAGFYEMLRLIKGLDKINYFKGQIIGPISFGLTVKDQNNQSVFFNQDLQEVITQSLAMKAKWQIRQIRNRKVSPQAKIIIFIDEPYLVSIGSSYIPLKKEEVISQINEVASAIHQEDALAGIHCCGNTDWGLVMDTQIDILNFDAYNFLDTLILYPRQLKTFLDRGGILAWGIAPNLELANRKSIKDLLVDKILKTGQEKGLLKNQVIITPSCGCGTLSVAWSENIHNLAVEVAQELNNREIR